MSLDGIAAIVPVLRGLGCNFHGVEEKHRDKVLSYECEIYRF
jgi:hypothetical protein